ncbi:hypothetical protein BV22DRAFT_1121533 [Leucogyrophana mollusca]|uniref:Uncharacterized protein n=1 Tax=Leucogyrophana mollusca TaxID=85980 RepID=A0ACB8B998_9AGAM|nr:hypothetical protein BV22DRAFT_1121533 [Leucogyrophana mollusca]
MAAIEAVWRSSSTAAIEAGWRSHRRPATSVVVDGSDRGGVEVELKGHPLHGREDSAKVAERGPLTSVEGTIRHPWFDPPPMKRKLREDDPSPRFSSLSSPSTTPSRKRRRCTALENGFAHLTLSNSLPPVSPSAASPSPSTTSPVIDELLYPPSDAVSLMAVDGQCTVILPSSVEEPTSPQRSGVPEIAMECEADQASLLADLGSSDANEKAVDTKTAWLTDVTISSALIDRLKKQTKALHPIVHLAASTTDDSKALVLFKPLPIPTAVEFHDDDDDPQASPVDTCSVSPSSHPTPSHDEDAMEVEFF